MIELKESHRCFAGTQGVYTHQSETLASEMEFSLYLPPSINDSPVPVLFYLSGLTCSQDNVTTKSGFQQYAAQHGVAIVCPDTSPRGKNYPGEHDDYDFGSGAGFYLNATSHPWCEAYRMYDYVLDELPGLIALAFPVDISRAGIFGHSMGGHGALTIGLKHPDIFKTISAFAPISAPSEVPWGIKAFTGYLGADRKTWEIYDANLLVRSGYRCPHPILIDQGSTDPFLEEQLRPWIFQESCASANQALHMRMQEGYDHSYFFISTFMESHISHHATILKSLS